MRRLLTALFAVVAMSTASGAAMSATPPSRAAVIMLWTTSDPQSLIADVRCLDVALRAPFEIGAPARALRSHPAVRFAIALSPAYANSIECAGADPFDAASRATGAHSDVRTRDVLRLLAAMPPLTASEAATPGGRELATLTVDAQQWLANPAQDRISTDDVRRAASLDAVARAANAGSAAARALLEQPPPTAALLRAANDVARSSMDAMASATRDAVSRGALEFVATPDGDPILPLLIDSGGKTLADPSVLPLNAAADATAMIDDAIAGITPLDDSRKPGLLSPFGAYDDATAQLAAARGARFAVFSDRVLQTSQAGGSVEALRAAQASSYLLYGLALGKTTTLPLLFWADDASRALDGLATSLPPQAFAARVTGAAAAAGATSADGSPRVITLRVQMSAPWAARPDAEAVVDQVASALARSGASATPSGYLGAHRTMTSVYGFAAGSTLGSLDAFTATPNQAAMWAALAQARDAVGGDAALKTAAIREPLLNAESGDWYLAPLLPLAQEAFNENIDDFRADLRAAYAAANKPAPAVIAPMRASTPPPVRPSPNPASPAPASTASPTPKSTGGYPQGL
jgi:hypothetical protein